MTIAGIAFLVEGRPNGNVDSDENIRRILQMLTDAPEHSVLATQSNDDEAAHISELSVTSLLDSGCRGAIIDGGARDVDFILDTEFPVFTRYNTPADAVPRWEILDWGVTAVVGDVEVVPGDVLVGDVDGVVCVPSAIADEVLDAEQVDETEDDVRDAVRNGVSLLDAYE